MSSTAKSNCANIYGARLRGSEKDPACTGRGLSEFRNRSWLAGPSECPGSVLNDFLAATPDHVERHIGDDCQPDPAVFTYAAISDLRVRVLLPTILPGL